MAESLPPVGAGILNVGQTWFANAVVQGLLHCRGIRSAIYGHSHSDSEDKVNKHQ